jgi:diguanylate cyclase (GGDEF)-like protein/PAS domain S-box-containing protein
MTLILQTHPFSLLLALSTIASAVVAIVAWQRRSSPGAIPLAILMAGLTIWAGTYAIMWATTTRDAQIFWLNATYFGVVIVPISFLAFASQITQNEQWITFRNLALLSIEPLLTLFIVWTNPFHHLFHASFTFEVSTPWVVLVWERGPWFWLNVFYSYALIVIGVMLLVRAFLRAGPLYRAQIGTILVGSLIPWVTNIYTEFGFAPSNTLDLTPIAFSASGLVIAYALFRQRLLDLIPVARSRLIENMQDGVLVLDDLNRIVDVNPAAEQFFGVTGKEVLGQPVGTILSEWTDLAEPFQDVFETRTEVVLPEETHRYLDLSITPLKRIGGRFTGRLIVFRDITEFKQTNEKLRDQLTENKILQSKLREQAIRDPLTNLFNRRYLEETIEREIARAKREEYQISLLLLDIDHFKKINDSYGHKAGDIYLQALGELIRVQTRRGDVPCRFGGEEFVMVLPNVSAQTAFRRAEEVRQEIADMVIHFNGAMLQSTVSIGIATYPTHGTNSEVLIDAADKALYIAKSSGRNLVVVSDYQPSTQSLS